MQPTSNCGSTETKPTKSHHCQRQERQGVDNYHFPCKIFPADNTAGRTIRLAYVRLDVSGLSEKAEIPISSKRGADATVPLAASGAVSGVVGVVAMGLAVTALACAGSQALPTVTVTEGFKGRRYCREQVPGGSLMLRIAGRTRRPSLHYGDVNQTVQGAGVVYSYSRGQTQRSEL